jgi:DNA polymerase-2
MLHAIVDALYIQKRGTPDDEYAELIRAISEATRLPIELEGVYHWIAFLPSRQDPRLPVANRYFGVFRDGEIKIRGIETRRHDTPPFIKRAQNEMIAILAQAQTRGEFRARMSEVLNLAAHYLDALYAGKIPFEQLVITQRLSREPQTYRTNHLNAIVAKQLLNSGVELAAGERIQYVILENDAPVPSDRARAVEQLDGTLAYDAERYAELLVRSVTTLLSGLGVKQTTLEKHFAAQRALPAQLSSPLDKAARQELPLPPPELPLFAWAKQNRAATAAAPT